PAGPRASGLGPRAAGPRAVSTLSWRQMEAELDRWSMSGVRNPHMVDYAHPKSTICASRPCRWLLGPGGSGGPGGQAGRVSGGAGARPLAADGATGVITGNRIVQR